MWTVAILPAVLQNEPCALHTHGCVSAAKKDTQHASVLFTGITKPHFQPSVSIYIATVLTFTYLIYIILYALHVHDHGYQRQRKVVNLEGLMS